MLFTTFSYTILYKKETILKIISWNVNGIRAIEKKGFISWLLNSEADIVCIQETKANPNQLSFELLNPGQQQENEPNLFAETQNPNFYQSYFSSAKKPGYSGTAIYSKKRPDKIETLGIPEFDDEGRTTFAYYGNLIVISAYFPNSQGPDLRLGYKLDFCNAIYERISDLVNNGYDIVLCGDYNIAHTPLDLANPKSNENNAGYLPEERAWMDFFTSHGFIDTFRMFTKEKGHYSWWSYRFHAREKDIGWRLDYHCVNERLKEKVISSTISKDIMGSDHCPIVLELKD